MQCIVIGGVTSTALAGQGILGTAIDAVVDEPINRVAAQFAESYRGWLLPADGGRWRRHRNDGSDVGVTILGTRVMTRPIGMSAAMNSGS
jgi:hypothetical protein